MSAILPASAIALFEETVNPIWPEMADVAVANLTPIPPSDFAGGATPTATWQAQAFETIDAFKGRITADLKANGTLTGNRPGALVQIYSRGGFWVRNVVGAANLPPVA